MIGRSMLGAAVALALLSGPALAGHCPLDVKAIDDGLGKVNLAADVKAEVLKLRDEGAAQHKAGEHGDSVKTLSHAMRLILSNM